MTNGSIGKTRCIQLGLSRGQKSRRFGIGIGRDGAGGNDDPRMRIHHERMEVVWHADGCIVLGWHLGDIDSVMTDGRRSHAIVGPAKEVEKIEACILIRYLSVHRGEYVVEHSSIRLSDGRIQGSGRPSGS